MARMKSCVVMCSLIIMFFLNACTTCREVKVNSVSDGEWIADIRYRVCGNYSGYSVALYRSNNLPASDGDKEQFQAIYESENRDVDKIPIHVQWGSNNDLIIHHDTRMSPDDDKSRPMVIKAEKSYQGVRIEYIPEPVIWGKMD